MLVNAEPRSGEGAVDARACVQVAAVSEAGRAYVWECRADAGGRVEAALRARVSVRAG